MKQTKIAENPAADAKAKEVEKALSQAHSSVEASYHWPFQNHGMLGPSCAVADVQGDNVTIWTGAQGPFTTRDRVASMLQLPQHNVDVRWAEISGGDGRPHRGRCC